MSRLAVRLTQLVVLVGGFGFVEALARAGKIRTTVLPAPPSKLFRTLWDEFAAGAIWPHLGATAMRVGTAFGLALVVGFAIGIALWKLPVLASALEPLLASLYAVPWLAFYPVLLVLMGLGNGPMIVTAMILGLVPLALNTYIGFSEVGTILLKVGRVNHLSPRQTLVKILLPAASPYVVSGMKLGFLYAYLGVIGTEFLQSSQGLGFLVSTSFFFFQDLKLYAYILFIVAITLVLFYGLDQAEQWIGRRFA